LGYGEPFAVAVGELASTGSANRNGVGRFNQWK
jgi:hypothetical protein